MFDIPVKRYERNTLVKFSVDYLKALGAADEEAMVTAQGIVTAASRWHPGKGQGLERLIRLTNQAKVGGINFGVELELVSDTPAVALLDAHKALGYYAAQKAMELAIGKARNVGTGTVIVRHSNNFGQAGFHAEAATKAGMIGFVMTNAAPEMPPWGGKQPPVLGTNPWGLGIPRDGTFPILLDMALTMSGSGMVKWAFREGKSIPDNWVMTLEGKRSTNPADFIAEDGKTFVGTQMPLGGFKGYGLSLFTDILAGVLSGSSFGMNCYREVSNNDVGHYMYVINQDMFMDHGLFQERLAQLVEEIKTAEPIEAGGNIFLPGEQEYLNEEKNLKIGIPIDEKTVEILHDLAIEQNVECPL